MLYALDASLMTIIRDLIIYSLNIVLIYLLLPCMFHHLSDRIDKQIKGLNLFFLELHDKLCYCILIVDFQIKGLNIRTRNKN